MEPLSDTAVEDEIMVLLRPAPGATTTEDEIMVLLRPAPGATTTEDEIMVLLRPAPGYDMTEDEQMFLKSSSKNGFDYYRETTASGNDHGEFWFEDLHPGHTSEITKVNFGLKI